MRLYLPVVVLLACSPLAAQTPKARPSVSFGVAGPNGVDLRVVLQPLVHGRSAYGVSLSRWSRGGGATFDFGPSAASEYTVDVHARAYPVGFASGRRQLITGYVGGFVGVDRREEQPAECLYCPQPRSPSGPPPSIVAYGLEPGAEIGLRFSPFNEMFVEVGGRARVITFADPTGRFVKGQAEGRLTLAVGVGW